MTAGSPPTPDVIAESRARGCETRDVSARNVLYALSIVFALIALAGGVAAALLGPRRTPQAAPTLEAAETKPPRPRLQLDPVGDRRALEATARAKLQTYAWVDESRGLARIPIDRAMSLLVRQGWPGGGLRPGPATSSDTSRAIGP